MEDLDAVGPGGTIMHATSKNACVHDVGEIRLMNPSKVASSTRVIQVKSLHVKQIHVQTYLKRDMSVTKCHP